MANLPLGYTVRVAQDGILSPASPKVSQKWQRQQFGSSSWADTGSTGSTYTVTNTDRNCKIRLAQTFSSGQELYSNSLQVDNFAPPFAWEKMPDDTIQFETGRIAYDRESGVFVIGGKRGSWAKTNRAKRRQYEWQYPTKAPSGMSGINSAWYLPATDQAVFTNTQGGQSSIVYATLDDFVEQETMVLWRPWGWGPMGAYDFSVDAWGGGFIGNPSIDYFSTGQSIGESTWVDTVGQYLDSSYNVFGTSDRYVYKFTGISGGLIQYDKQLLPFVGTHNKFANSLAYHNGTWVAVGGNNHLFTSTNWRSWRANNSIIAAFPNNTNITGVCYAANKWWVTGWNRNKVLLASSPDAENWTKEDLPDGLPETGVLGGEGASAFSSCPKMAGYDNEAIWTVTYGTTKTRVCKLVV